MYAYSLYAFACYGEVGGGHVYVCQFSELLVDQPLSALPPSLGREW
ncbi:hypothetical protein KTI55_04315 [Acinetobacter ursingii]|nr:hypothetical protein [Acinetobacter ursingii]